jgi:hypothetical protein
MMNSVMIPSALLCITAVCQGGKSGCAGIRPWSAYLCTDDSSTPHVQLATRATEKGSHQELLCREPQHYRKSSVAPQGQRAHSRHAAPPPHPPLAQPGPPQPAGQRAPAARPLRHGSRGHRLCTEWRWSYRIAPATMAPFRTVLPNAASLRAPLSHHSVFGPHRPRCASDTSGKNKSELASPMARCTTRISSSQRTAVAPDYRLKATTHACTRECSRAQPPHGTEGNLRCRRSSAGTG